MIGLRLITNAGSRMMFTFLPEFSRGTGIGVDQLGRLLSVRDLTALAAPAIGRRTDRVGTGRVMILSCVLATAGMILFSLGASGVFIGVVAFGLGRIGFMVGMNAWIGHEVAYERRGRASGQVEMTWAAAALIGLPTIGLLIDRLGWRAAPMAISIALLPLTAGLAGRLPKPTVGETGPSRRPTMTAQTWSALGAFALLNGAVQLLVFGHGLWLEQTYDFDPSQIGFAIIAVGVAELIASFTSSRITDRIGKRNSITVGSAVLTVGLAGLAFLEAPPLGLGIGLLVLSFLGFEFAVVSAIPLVAELDPQARAEIIGRSVGLSIMARAAGSLVASVLILDQGFRVVMVVATVLAAITTAVTAGLVKEPTGR